MNQRKGSRNGGGSAFIFAYHAEKVGEKNMADEAKRYPMITKNGEKQTREKTKKTLVGAIEKLPNGSVMVLGGVSTAARTRSTLDVYFDELWKLLSGRDDIVFSRPIENSGSIIPLRKDAKAVVNFPYYIPEFISIPGQSQKEIAKNMLAGLSREEAFFRRFFPPGTPMTFFNIIHNPELSAFINFVAKKGTSSETKFSFM